MRKLPFCMCENKSTDQLRCNLYFRYIHSTIPNQGSAVAWWLMPRTPDPEVGGSSPTRVKPCCVLKQGIFTPQKVLVIPRKQWLRPNMTEKLFTGTLRINQPTNQQFQASSYLLWLYSLVCVIHGWKPRRQAFSHRVRDVK